MSPRNRRLAALCLCGGLALAVVGQYYFARRRAYMWDGVFLYGLASALFLGAVSLANPAPALAAAGAHNRVGSFAWLWEHRWRALLVALSALGTLAVAARARGPLSPSQGYGLLALWSAAVLAYLAAMIDPRASWAWLRGAAARLRAHRWEALFVLGITLAGAAARLVSLGSIPYILGGDEASMGMQVQAVLNGRISNPFATAWLSHPTLYYYLVAGALRLVGSAVAGLRFLPAVAGVLAIPALYLLARELFDRWIAGLAAAYLAFYHYAVHYSRLGLNNMMDPVLAVLTFYLLLVGVRTRRRECFAVSGVCLGLAQYFYTGSRLVPLIVMAYVVWLMWRKPGSWATHRGNLALLAAGFLVTGLPLFVFFADHPRDFMARVNQLGIIQSGWLVRASQALGRSQASLLWEQFVKSALAFHYYLDPTDFYAPRIPMLDFLSAIPFTFGLVYAMTHLRERGHALFALWFWAVVISGGMLLENPPSSQRLLLTVIPVSVFLAVGLNQIGILLERIGRWRPVALHPALAVVLVGLAVINLAFYFRVYTPSHRYGGLNNEVGYRMGLYLHSLGPGYRYYFLGAPRMFAGFSTVAYLAPQVPGVDVLDASVDLSTVVVPGERPVFVFLPERQRELEAVQQLYPNGQLSEFRRPSGDLLFVAYEPSEVPNGTSPQ